jgi:deazaflavin-dependent oxidoreductase (nitroreductase family)
MAGPPAGTKYFNKVALLASGRRAMPLWAVLHHRGRRSGKEYSIPVAVLASDDAFTIALPWGRGTDWVRNVRAAGGCRITWKGRDFACTEPEFVDKAQALAVASGVAHFMLGKLEVEAGFLRLQRPPAG